MKLEFSHIPKALIYAQLIALTIVCLFCLAFYDFQVTLSALLGGLAWLIPSIIFAWRMRRDIFSPKEGQTAQRVLKKFLLTELLKLIASAVLIIIIVNILTLNLFAFIIGYVATVISIMLLPILI